MKWRKRNDVHSENRIGSLGITRTFANVQLSSIMVSVTPILCRRIQFFSAISILLEYNIQTCNVANELLG